MIDRTTSEDAIFDQADHLLISSNAAPPGDALNAFVFLGHGSPAAASIVPFDYVGVNLNVTVPAGSNRSHAHGSLADPRLGLLTGNVHLDTGRGPKSFSPSGRTSCAADTGRKSTLSLIRRCSVS
jgi:hypothetical protein